MPERANHKVEKPIFMSLRGPKALDDKGHEEAQRWRESQSARVVKPGESVLHKFDRVPLAPVPAPLVGMRKVTEAVAQLVVNTLMPGATGNWQLDRSNQPSALSIQSIQNQKQNPFTTEMA